MFLPLHSTGLVRRRAIALILTSVVSLAATSERARSSLVRDHFSVADGLPVVSLNDIAQTPDGYLWVSTLDGLARFDGQRFTVFRTGNTPELPTDRLQALYVAADSSLWMTTDGFGAVRMKDGIFTAYPFPQARTAYTGFYEDTEGTLWVRDRAGVRRLADGRFERFPASPDEAPALATHREPGGRLWWVSRDGIFRSSGEQTERVGTVADLDSFSGLEFTDDGDVWFVTTTAIYRYRDVLEPIDVPGAEPPYTSVTVRENTIFIQTGSGLFRHSNDEWRQITTAPWGRVDDLGHVWSSSDGTHLHRDDEPILGEGVIVKTVGHDHEGGTWIVTARSGLYRLSEAPFDVIGAEEGLLGTSVYAIWEERSGDMLVGTLGGLTRLDRARGWRTEPFAMPPTAVYDVLRDRANRVWVGCANWSGLRAPLMVSDGGGPFASIDTPLSGSVYAIHEDREGAIWFGAENGLFRMRGSTWERMWTGKAPAYVRSFCETDHGLWMGTYGDGLLHYDGARLRNIDASAGLSSNKIRGIFEDSHGVLWIGTEGLGLARMSRDPLSPTISVIRQHDGLYDDVIHEILEDDQGRLWLNSNRGVFWCMRSELEAFVRGDRARVTSIAYTERHGLRSREGNGGAGSCALRDAEGRMWFATVEGVAIVDPEDVPLEAPPPPLIIEGVFVGDQPRPAGAAGVELARGERSFQIAYTAISFQAPASIDFRHRLDGLDDDWREVGNLRTAYYTNVPPGRHLFHVAATHGPSGWGEERVLAIVVPPFVHETPWFRGALVVLALGVAYGFYRYRMHTQQQRLEAVLVESERRKRVEIALRKLGQRLIHAQEDERRRLSRELHDDLSQRLALINIEISMLGKRTGEDVAELKSLASELADDLRRLSHNLHPGKLEQLGLVTSLSSLCREVSERTGMSVEFQDRTDGIDAPPESGLCAYRIAQEALRNAWKYSRSSEAAVALSRTEGGICMEVIDRGAGFDPEADAETGLGLLSMTERARAAGGELHIESAPGRGTKIRLNIPLDHVESVT